MEKCQEIRGKECRGKERKAASERLRAKFWKNQGQIAENWKAGPIFQPHMDLQIRERLYGKWRRAVERAQKWQVY